MKLDQDDVARICQRVVDHNMDTALVAEQFEITRRRVQQLAKEYRDNGKVSQLETPGRRPYAEYPADLEQRIFELRQRRALAQWPLLMFSGLLMVSRSLPTASIRSFRSTNM